MRESRGALARIARQHDGETQWLVRWNRKWKSFALIGGHLESGETYRECLLREIEEEIGLREPDVTAAENPTIELSYTAFSKRVNAETQYTLLLFDVDIAAATAVRLVDDDERLRWVSHAEMHAEKTHDGKDISDVVKRFYAATE